MKTVLKLLNVLLVIFMAALSFNLFEKLYQIIHFFVYNSEKLAIKGVNFPSSWSNTSIIFYTVIGSCVMLLLIFLVFVFRKVLLSFSKRKFFSTENVFQLKKVGYGLMLYASIVFVLKLSLKIGHYYNDAVELSSYNLGYAIGIVLAKVISIFIVSLFILLIASVVKEGNIIKSENDLTI